MGRAGGHNGSIHIASCMENPPRYFPLISLSGTIHRDHVFVDTPLSLWDKPASKLVDYVTFELVEGSCFYITLKFWNRVLLFAEVPRGTHWTKVGTYPLLISSDKWFKQVLRHRQLTCVRSLTSKKKWMKTLPRRKKAVWYVSKTSG